jgi:UDP-N-acetylmuramoylalanine--D-glutamate ligase
MIPLSARKALVVGSDASAAAAAALLRGLRVAVVEAPDGRVQGEGVDLVVVGAGAGDVANSGVRDWIDRGVPVIGERELAFRQSYCLHVAVTGACGKRTAADLIAHVLRASGRQVEVAAGPDRPACALVDRTRDLDFLVHAVAPEELEHLVYFRPVVGVLLNAPERDEAEAGEAGMRRFARLFATQQPFDWAVVESRAMARMEAAGVALNGKGITFSSESRVADLGFDRGLLVSRIEGWSGPLWDMARGGLRGPHLAEDALAALAVGRVLRLGLEDMTSALEGYRGLPGRFEYLGEAGGVRFVHDGGAGHLEALDRALVSLAATRPEHPFVWLIAGGDRVGRAVYDLGPVLSSRVRHVFLLGGAAAPMRAAWQLFTPCTPVASLLDAANRAVEQASPGDVVLFSPGCPSRGISSESETGTDAFREVFRARLRVAGGSEGGRMPSWDYPRAGARGGGSAAHGSAAAPTGSQPAVPESRPPSASPTPGARAPSTESRESHRS